MAKEGTVAPKERINIKYRSEEGGAQEAVELPFKMMVLGDFTQKQDDRVIEERKPISIDENNFDDSLQKVQINKRGAIGPQLKIQFMAIIFYKHLHRIVHVGRKGIGQGAASGHFHVFKKVEIVVLKYQIARWKELI